MVTRLRAAAGQYQIPETGETGEGAQECGGFSTAGGGTPERARLVADYLAGMTDRFALDEHRRLFDTYAPT